MLAVVVAAALAASNERAQLLDRATADFEIALKHNDSAALERVLAPDWMIIDSDGRLIARARFLGVLRTGELSHSDMRSTNVQIRLLGDSALYVARVDGHGTYAGQDFSFSERATDVWVWADGEWRCALTQLTRIASAEK